MAKDKRKAKPLTESQPNKPVSHIQPGPDNYINRELAWLEFNRRVLIQASDDRWPLLERLNFLLIFSSNTDEFVMKRIGLLKRRIEAGMLHRRPDKMTPRQQLSAVRKKLLELLEQRDRIFSKELIPMLAKHGIKIIQYRDLDEEDRKFAQDFFKKRVFPVLTPLAVDPGHPFPFISNLSTSLAVLLKHPETDLKLFARVKVPQVLPPLIRLENKSRSVRYNFIGLIDIIANNIDKLFPGMKIQDVMPFRITRNADMERDEEDTDDLLDLIEQEVKQRRFEPVIRMEYAQAKNARLKKYFMNELELEDDDVYAIPSILDFTSIKAITSLPLPDLRFDHWSGQIPKPIQDEDADIFSLIRKKDLLIHHPYESFHSSIERFVSSAAEDPAVLAIKITIYRTGLDSPFIPALIRAAEAGKQVVAIVELKARFEEEKNIRVAQSLEKVGIHVVYGIIGLKTHTKTALVVRQESDGLRCYAHIGTGNYNAQTAKLYTDLSLLTCRPELTSELVELFHYLTGRSLKQVYKTLLVAPFNMREKFIDLIGREIKNKKAGKPAGIIAKMNSIDDEGIFNALMEASMAGVPIDLIIRGFCCIRPGIPKMTQNIHVISIIGRFLEHSRIFYFAAGESDPLKGDFFIGSADWLTRNLSHRIEVIAPIFDGTAKIQTWNILKTMLDDNRLAWVMQPDGSYLQRKSKSKQLEIDSEGTHSVLMAYAKGRNLPVPDMHDPTTDWNEKHTVRKAENHSKKKATPEK